MLANDGKTSRESCEKWVADFAEYSREHGYTAHAVMRYPRLSTTGDGMLLLMQALRRARRSWGVEEMPTELQAWVWNSTEAQTASHDSPPMALALAAAQALGIEVPR